METMDVGVIYTAEGDKYVKEAMLSAKSLKNHCPDLSITIFTDKGGLSKKYVDRILTYNKESKNKSEIFLDRIRMLKKTPYDRTIALDTDTYIMDSISQAYKLLDKYDLCMAHGHNRFLRKVKPKKLGVYNNEPPYAFGILQGGVILYEKNDKTSKFIDEVEKRYRENEYYDDQAIFHEVLWESNIKEYILPREYNFNSFSFLKKSEKNKFKKGIPKIFHYTQHSIGEVESKIGRYENKIKEYKKHAEEGRIDKIYKLSLIKKMKRKVKTLFYNKWRKI